MSLNHSPSVVTNGLVFYADMNNTQKSWKGRPVTNQFTLPTAATNGFGVQNSTFTRVYTGTYGNYTIQPTDYVWQYNINGNDCPYHGWDIATTAGDVVTFSFDYYISPTTVGYPSTNYLANFENAGSGVSGSVADPTPSIIGVWKRAYITSTATATGNSRCLMYPGACGAQLATGTGFILYKNPQVEFNAPGGIPTPFVAGTRSNTQAIVDLTGNNTITATSLTYASDNTFSFNGSSSLAFANPLSTQSNATQEWSVISWVNINTTANQLLLTGINNGLYLTTGSNTTLLYLNSGANDYYTYGTAVGGAGWCQVAYRFKNSTGARTIYKNGVNITTSGPNNTSTPAGNSGTFTLGSGTNGSIGATMIYNRYITDDELMQIFNAQRGRYGI